MWNPFKSERDKAAEHFRRGGNLLRRDQWDEAFEELQLARKYLAHLSPKDRGMMLVALGLLHEGRGEKRQALDALDQAIKLFSGTGTLGENVVSKIREGVQADDIGDDGRESPGVTLLGKPVSLELDFLMQSLLK